MTRIAPVIDRVVRADMCIGCGLCAAVCPEDALRMEWSEDGFMVASQQGECEGLGQCIQVCPFNPDPMAEVRTETELAGHFLPDAPHHNGSTGNYYGFYAGHSTEFRATSSSGGLATYVCTKLLERGLVDGVISVRPASGADEHFEYCIARSVDEIRATARTRYFPVTMEHVLRVLREQEGAVALVGIACFVKAIRLAQKVDPNLHEKIRFVVGIICGGIKSRFFTDYLSGLQGTGRDRILGPEYRIKDASRPASDYSFGHTDSGTGARKEIRMRLVGDMWGTGLFKANACDFCDDVTTELADISVGDAWLEPYVVDGRGSNVLVVRSGLANVLIGEGIASGELVLDDLPLERFQRSQQGSFNHRQYGLPARIAMMRWMGRKVPPKRFESGWVHPDFWVVQALRRLARRKSLAVWREERDSQAFNRRMKFPLLLLRLATRANGKMKGLRRRLGRLAG